MTSLFQKTVFKLGCLFISTLATANTISEESVKPLVHGAIALEKTSNSYEGRDMNHSNAVMIYGAIVNVLNETISPAKASTSLVADVLYDTFKTTLSKVTSYADDGNWSLTNVLNAYRIKFEPLLNRISCFIKMITNYCY